MLHDKNILKSKKQIVTFLFFIAEHESSKNETVRKHFKKNTKNNIIV